MLESSGRSAGGSLSPPPPPIPGDEDVLESFTGLNSPPQSAVRGVVRVGVHNRSSLLEMSGVFSIFGVFKESISPRGDRSAAIVGGGAENY